MQVFKNLAACIKNGAKKTVIDSTETFCGKMLYMLCSQVTLWRGHYELTGEYEDLLRIRNRGSSPQKGWESVVTWLELEKSTNYFDPATMGYHHLHPVEDLGTMFSSPSQEHLVSVKNIDEDQTNFVEVCTN